MEPGGRAAGARGGVKAADADDVTALIRYASSAGIPVTVQPSGHGASGNSDGAILLRTGQLDQIQVDAGRQTARIGAGVRSGQVQDRSLRARPDRDAGQ